MKKVISIFLTMALTLSLAACGGTGAGGAEPSAPDNNTTTQSDATTDESSAPEQSTEPDAEPDETPDGEANSILIAYFSWSGNTEELAGMIQAETGGDLFAIEPETPYTDDYNALLDQAQQEQADNARPALAAQVENWEQYDTVFVGYPNWWGDAPMVVLSFLESYDCTGKRIVPFCTSGGGGFGSSRDSVEASAVGAEMLEGFHVGGSGVSGAQSDVAAWIDGLGFAQ